MKDPENSGVYNYAVCVLMRLVATANNFDVVNAVRAEKKKNPSYLIRKLMLFKLSRSNETLTVLSIL